LPAEARPSWRDLKGFYARLRRVMDARKRADGAGEDLVPVG